MLPLLITFANACKWISRRSQTIYCGGSHHKFSAINRSTTTEEQLYQADQTYGAKCVVTCLLHSIQFRGRRINPLHRLSVLSYHTCSRPASSYKYEMRCSYCVENS